VVGVRVIEPEILDGLDGSDPDAIRSRRELRIVDMLMGNSVWLLHQLGRERARWNTLVELGAGDGRLLRRALTRFPGIRAVGVDLAVRPTDLPASIGWERGDLREWSVPDANCVVCASLVLHHFNSSALSLVGGRLSGAVGLLCVEPHRHPRSAFFGACLTPWMGRVTRHDMPVSIRAGFRANELPQLLGLDGRWRWQESAVWRGALRLAAWRSE
jgi:hypothetical protein